MTLRHLAARAASSFRANTAYWTGNWRDRQITLAANQAEIEVGLFDLGPPLRIGERLADKPKEIIRFTLPLMKVFDENEINRSAGVDVRHALPHEISWGVRFKFKSFDTRALDPGPGTDPLEMDIPECPISGPHSAEQVTYLPRLIAELSCLNWCALQAEILARRAIFDTTGRLAAEEANRYLRHYAGIEAGDAAAALVPHDASTRERYLSLARKVRHVDSKLAAEYAKAAVDSLVADFEVLSASTYTTVEEFESYDDNFLVSDETGNLVNRSDVATGIYQEFEELRQRSLQLRADVGAQVARLSSRMEEGLAVWRDFMIAVLLRQGAVRQLPWFSHQRERTPADVIGEYENASSDSDYVSGFRLAARIALDGSPWLLSSLDLATAALQAPLELLKRRLPASDLIRLPADSPLAPNERLRLLTVMGKRENQDCTAWMELAFTTLRASAPPIPVLVYEVLREHERRLE